MTAELRVPSRPVGAEVSGLIRRREYAEAEAVLVDRLTEHPGPVATACRGLAADTVEIVDWESVAAALGRASGQGQPVTGIGLDLSNFSDADGADWWDKEPVVEVSLYDDTHFPSPPPRDVRSSRPLPSTPRRGPATASRGIRR